MFKLIRIFCLLDIFCSCLVNSFWVNSIYPSNLKKIIRTFNRFIYIQWAYKALSHFSHESAQHEKKTVVPLGKSGEQELLGKSIKTIKLTHNWPLVTSIPLNGNLIYVESVVNRTWSWIKGIRTPQVSSLLAHHLLLRTVSWKSIKYCYDFI